MALNLAGSSPTSPASEVTTPLTDTATTLAAPEAATEGHRLSLVATETADPTGSAAGMVVFTDKTKVLGSVAVTAADGTATLKTPKLLPGKHSFQAAFTPTDPETYGGSTSGAHKLTVVKIALANTLRPHLAGPHHKHRAIVGTTEKASHGTWSPKAASYSYRWYLGAHRIKGATGPTLLLKTSYRGKRLSCVVRAKRQALPGGRRPHQAPHRQGLAQPPPATHAAHVECDVPGVSAPSSATYRACPLRRVRRTARGRN